jgi:PAS domain S-box-containing protein
MDSGLPQAADLHQKAERRLRSKKDTPVEGIAEMDARALVQELQVHQIELEMQNEELLRAHAAAREASEKYCSLFDFAPVGFFLWDRDARILEVNLAGAALLGLDCGAVIQKRFGQFVAMEYRGAFADFCDRVLTTDTKQTCEVKLLKDGQAVDVLVEGIAAQDRRRENGVCRTAVIDITERKRLEAALHKARDTLEQRVQDRTAELAARTAKLAQEVVDRKQAQRELERYRDRYVNLYDFAPLGYVTLEEDGYIQEINLAGATMLAADRDMLIGYPLLDYVNERDKAAFLEHVQNCSRGRQEVTSEVTLIAKDGRALAVQLHSVPLEGSEAEVAFCKTAMTDITDRKRAEERVAQLTCWKGQLLGPSSLGEKLKLITDGVVNVLGADFARIWVVREGDLCEKGCPYAVAFGETDVCRDRTHCLHLLASSGRYPRIDGSHCRVPLGCYKIGRVATGADLKFTTNDVTHDPRVHDHQWAEKLGLVSFAGYRILSPDGKPLGVLAMFSQRAIDPVDEAALEDLANTSSQVIRAGMAEESLQQARDELEQRVHERTTELTRMVEQLQDAVRERTRAEESLRREWQTLQHLLQASDHDRQLIAYEIHDGLAQQLAAATMYFQAAENLGNQESAERAKAHAAGLTILRKTLKEARRLISDVRAPILDEEGIEAAIAHLVQEHREPNAPHIEFHSAVAFGRLEPIAENAIYRIAQEGLANACRHSAAKRVRIELVQQDNNTVRMEIRDWGVGFDPNVMGEQCFGLRGIRERARLLGGHAVIESAPGQGTRIVAELPLASPRAAQADKS